MGRGRRGNTPLLFAGIASWGLAGSWGGAALCDPLGDMVIGSCGHDVCVNNELGSRDKSLRSTGLAGASEGCILGGLEVHMASPASAVGDPLTTDPSDGEWRFGIGGGCWWYKWSASGVLGLDSSRLGFVAT